MMRAHHELQGHGLIPDGSTFVRMSLAGSSDHPACLALYRLPDGEVRTAAFVWSDGAFRFDWESWSAHGSILWREWLELKPKQEHELRVHVDVAEDSGHARPSVPATWKRVSLSHRDAREKTDAWLADESIAREILERIEPGIRS